MDDLLIIGAGWAGITAAAHAVLLSADRAAKTGVRLKIRLIAQGIGSMIVAPGWICAAPNTQGAVVDSVKAIGDRFPTHPYALAGADSLSAVLTDLYPSLKKKANIVYNFSPQNLLIPTALGQTYAAPATLFSVVNVASRNNSLFIGFEGWRDYYSALISSNNAIIKLPLERAWDATPTDIARAFDNPDFRAEVIRLVKPLSRGASTVYFPAVIGIDNLHEALDNLATQLGTSVGEVSTLPPSAPGTRFFTAMRRYLLDSGVRLQIGHPVIRGIMEHGRAIGVEVAGAGKSTRFEAKAILLATGGLYGGGLFSDDRGKVWEPLFHIPVQYIPDRTRWFNDTLLDPRGHPVHYFGVRANQRMQPLDEAGNLIAENLYVAGQILAHPNVDGAPLPTDTVEGVALATAYKAVASALESQLASISLKS
jgi:glycerol-3-phosphate dehydrogenase subunit B